VTSFTSALSPVIRIKTLPDGQVFSSYSDNSVRIWNVSNSRNWTLVCTFRNHTGQVYGIDFIRADTLVTGSLDRTIKIWRISTGVTTRNMISANPVYGVALLTDGVSLAAASGNFIFVYNINNGSRIATISGHSSTVIDLLVLSSTTLASSSFDRNVRIWNTNTRASLFTLTGHTLAVYGLKRVSADILASGSNDTTIKLWNITSGTIIRTLTGHSGQVLFSLDYMTCSILASGSAGTDGIRVWNIFSGLSSIISSSGFQIQSLAVYGTTSSENTFYFLNLQTFLD